MIEVIRGAHRIPGEAHCSCGTIFKFDYEDITQNNNKMLGRIVYWYHSVTCPVCKQEIELPDNLDMVCPWKVDKE